MARIAGLMAGGKGTRLRASGIEVPKPMLHVAGRPLVSFFLDQAAEVGVVQVVAAVRQDDEQIRDFLSGDERFLWTFVHPTTEGTFGAVSSLLDIIGDEDSLISTCDVLLPPGSLRRLLEASADAPKKAKTVILTTTLIHDTTPIWIHSDPNDSDVVTDVGKNIDVTDLVFGNVRWCRGDLHRHLASLPLQGLSQDTRFLSLLARSAQGIVRSYTEPDIIDVDDSSDLAFAEKLLIESPSYLVP